VLTVVLGLLRVGSKVMRLLPMPINMGMFAGRILGYATRLVTATVEETTIAGTTVAGFLTGPDAAEPARAKVGLAILAGGIAVLVTQDYESAPVAWELPTVAVPAMEFTLPAVLAISLPLVVLSMGIGNVQGLGFPIAQGYRVPVD
jgi:benzoate membrane transport protein